MRNLKGVSDNRSLLNPLLTVTIATCLAGSNALAQSPHTDSAGHRRHRTHDLSDIQVMGRTKVQEVSRQSYNVTAIDAKKLYNTTLDISHALDRVSGVRVREDGGVGSRVNFSLNGFTGRAACSMAPAIFHRVLQEHHRMIPADNAPAAASRKGGKVKVKKKHNRSVFYRVCAWLHLWVGLVTGLIVMVVCLTGCIWIFNDEINLLLHPETRVAKQERSVLVPSQLYAIAKGRFPQEKVAYASYQQGRAAYVGLGEPRKPTALLRVNPYTGEVVRVQEFKKGEQDFFRWILNGHRFLWMSPKVGRPIINYSTLIFVGLLITGMVLWWPRKWSKSARQQAFRIKWKGSAKRVNYDLHNVLGFYSLLALTAIALSGMVYGIEWWSKGLYWVTTGGRILKESRPPKSDSLQAGRLYTPSQVMDGAWNRVIKKAPEATGFYYSYPDTSKPSAPISILIYPTAGKFYDRRNYLFDQHTLKELKGNPVFDGDFKSAKGGDKLRRTNYEIHVGSILGLPGRILAFFASLIGASLPVTGFIIWFGKKRKQWRKLAKAKTGKAQVFPVSEPILEGEI